MNRQKLATSKNRSDASFPKTSYSAVGLAIGVGCGTSIGNALDARSKRDDSLAGTRPDS